MRMINPTRWHGRGRFLLLCAGLLLAGCGLTNRNGSVAAGAQYLDGGKYRAAYIESKKVLQREDKNGEAWLLLGRATLMLGNPKDALSDLEKARANGVPPEDWAVPMGRTLLVMGQFDEALKALPKTDGFKPAVAARVAALRGDALNGLNQRDAAQQAYEAALKLQPNEPHALVGLARIAMGAGDTAAANKYVEQAIAASAENPQAWIAKGDLAFAARDFTGAATDYKKVLGFKHADWVPQEHYYTLGRLATVEAEQGQLDAALTNIVTLEKMAPGQPYPHYLHAVVLFRQGHLDDSVSQLQQVLKVAPNNVPAQLLMGTVNYAQGNYGQAEMYLGNVMGVAPDNTMARKLLALTLFREGRSSQALSTLRPAAPKDATDAQLVAMLQRGVAEGVGTPKEKLAGPAMPGAAPASSSPFAKVASELVSGNAAEAVQLLKAMPANDPATAAERNQMLAMSYVRDQQPDEAVKSAAAYAAQHPDDSGAHLVYGTALVAAGKRDAARPQYEQAIKLNPKSFAAVQSLASLDSVEGKYPAAASRYETYLKAEPGDANAMYELGRLAALQGDKAGTIKWFQQATEANPKLAGPYVGLVMLYSESGQFDQASAVAKQFAATDPDNPVAFNTLGAAELAAGKPKDALEPLQQAVKRAPDVALFRTNLARAQILNKDSRDAEDNLNQVLKAHPEELTATSLLAFLKLQNHDQKGALALAQGLQKQSAANVRVAGYALAGDLYMSEKSYNDAANAYQQGLGVTYERPLVVKRFIALNLAGAKDPQAVLTDWLAKHPDDAASRLMLGQYYLDHAQNGPAATQYEAVLKAFPTNVGALNNLAWIYGQQHDPRALGLAERAYKLAPAVPNVMDTYAWLLVAQDKAGEALPILTKAAAAEPKSGTIQYHLAAAQARTGDKNAAKATLAALLKPDMKFQERPEAEKLFAELGSAR